MSASNNEVRTKVLVLLRAKRFAAGEIARLVGVSPQVVWGIKSHWSLGKYGDEPQPPQERPAPHIGYSWTYLLLSAKGEVYLGATTNLRKRLLSHNSPLNDGFTRGRKWHLLAAKRFETRKEAFDYEGRLKRSMTAKNEWKLRSINRAMKIVQKYGYTFDPQRWSGALETF